MRDRNGIEIVTGNFVKISNAYCKSDNGLYFVTASPGDPSWSGDDHALKKVCKNGKISDAKYSVCFWPVKSFVNDRWKRAEANEWNKEHAEIEVVKIGNTEPVAWYFSEKAANADEWAKRGAYNWGEDHPEFLRNKKIRDFYMGVAERVKYEGVA